MFSEINSLIFLLIFLVCLALCLIVYHRISVPCSGNESWPEGIKKLLLCGLTALLLTAAVIYLWYLAVLLMAVIVKYLYSRCASARTKWLLTAGILIFMALVAAAGIQLMVSRNADEEDDAVIEEVTEDERASAVLGEDRSYCI